MVEKVSIVGDCGEFNRELCDGVGLCCIGSCSYSGFFVEIRVCLGVFFLVIR